MFVRRIPTKTGRVYYALTESYRDPTTGKPRQRHIRYLGKEPPPPEELARLKQEAKR